uniref:Uncharacterized protein n=1 Tax=Rousettus aegyptiacus TaxID=9407 RepID=A0A7J8D7U3_ROUAE|nr:hypothetical protein HJG63_015680 [Rousettus aegyptiacus]
MSALLQDPMIAGQVSKPLLSVRSEMNAELRGEDKAATSDSELNEPLLAPVESNDSEDTPSKLFVLERGASHFGGAEPLKPVPAGLEECPPNFSQQGTSSLPILTCQILLEFPG